VDAPHEILKVHEESCGALCFFGVSGDTEFHRQ
jgi:hypothetical protein